MRKNHKPQTTNHKFAGFTLIELIVVIAIVAILTSLATVNFNQARVRARDVQRKSELRQIQNALELYKNDKFPQAYPPEANRLDDLVPTYMARLPIDPKEKATNGSWQDYSYTLNGMTYTLEACLENASDPDKSVGTCTTASGVPYLLSN